ncbi:extracellular solute-binding protein [Alkalihalobacillus sp. MEB130]|uniref:ABC transporter substrate-binding protein n=1 Tax=Alkalihalobacillus sp. MEB130 TaxID=2976704 RepID=UPI0028E014B0|nr:extracellular solute-binding protein [Alkalihalobacillus sp. MEB130]MDT8860167.1 extracellular solute-binding protein [Alkalihalobacillus sp. MEB130]
MKLGKGGFMLFIYVLIMFVAACSNESDDERGSLLEDSNKTIVYLSTKNEDQGHPRVIMPLSREFEKRHLDVNVELQTVAQNDLVQTIQLLAASNDLPEMFALESRHLDQMYRADLILDVEKTFKTLGIYETLNPTVVDLLKRQSESGNSLYAVPVELNIEGFWYNKQIFEEVGVEIPTTWDEMMNVSESLKTKGIQPFALAGRTGSSYTRLINAYVVRKYGFDVMERVHRGELDLLDDGFIEAVEIVQQMNEKGYFGDAVNSVDYEKAVNMFLNGQAAIIYMGSWVLSDFNDLKRNNIGVENIGFFNVPLVKDGVGTMDDYMMNAGLVKVLSKEKFDEEVVEWVKFIFSNYGEHALSEYGMISGFFADEIPEEVSNVTRITLDEIQNARNGALWFEAQFDEKTAEKARYHVHFLVTGEISPEDYLSILKQ